MESEMSHLNHHFKDTNADCPTPQELAAFIEGDDSIDRPKVEQHVLECDRCVQVIGHAAGDTSDDIVPVPGHVVDDAMALVPYRSIVYSFVRGPGAWRRSALAAAACLAFAVIGYGVGQETGTVQESSVDFVRAVSFEALGEPAATDDLDLILLSFSGEER